MAYIPVDAARGRIPPGIRAVSSRSTRTSIETLDVRIVTLNRYSGNRSALALDLVAAALRQSGFVDEVFRVAHPLSSKSSPFPGPLWLTLVSKARVATQPSRDLHSDFTRC